MPGVIRQSGLWRSDEPHNRHSQYLGFTVNLVRRYWAPALIIVMVAVHGISIGYVRSRVSTLTLPASTAVSIGRFRIQPHRDVDHVYHFQLHAVIDPSQMVVGQERLVQKRMEIMELAERLLRDVDPQLLRDVEQTQIRQILMDKVLGEFFEDMNVIQRVLITDWLTLPVESVAIQLPASDSLALVN
ncbi:MAG: hypothetical protein AAGA03_07335 [Planctomycetota bacterium]